MTLYRIGRDDVADKNIGFRFDNRNGFAYTATQDPDIYFGWFPPNGDQFTGWKVDIRADIWSRNTVWDINIDYNDGHGAAGTDDLFMVDMDGYFDAGAGADTVQVYSRGVLAGGIYLGYGDDTLGQTGGGGPATVWGGSGNDLLVDTDKARKNSATGSTLFGDGPDRSPGPQPGATWAGDDTISGNGANDTIDGGEGEDSLLGGDGDDVIEGGMGYDTLIGDAGDDVLTDRDGVDILAGGEGSDLLDAGPGDDTLLALGGGRDTLDGGFGADFIDAGRVPATHVATYAGSFAGVAIDLATGTFEGGFAEGDRYANVTGIGTLIGSPYADRLFGLYTAILFGGEGEDTFGVRPEGVSTRIGDFSVEEDVINIHGYTGTQLFNNPDLPPTEVDLAPQDDGTLVILTGFDPSLLTARNFTDAPPTGPLPTVPAPLPTNRPDAASLDASGDASGWGGGADTVRGGAGDDTIAGHRGADDLFGEDGEDQLSGNVGRDLMRGGDGGDHLLGGRGADTLMGEAGGDRLAGGYGRDRLLGGAGHDRLRGGDGADRLTGGKGGDRLAGGAGHDGLEGGRGGDRMSGGDGDDLLRGGRGGDMLKGGAGGDTLDGGPGADRLVFDGAFGNDVVRGFEVGVDSLAIRGVSEADVSIRQADDGLVLTVDGPGTAGSILLAGVDRLAEGDLMLARTSDAPLVVGTTRDVARANASPGDPTLSLREALALAADGHGTDRDGDGLVEVVFDAAVFDGPATIRLDPSLGSLAVRSPVEIVGPPPLFGDGKVSLVLAITGDTAADDVTTLFDVGDGSLALTDVAASEAAGVLSDNVRVFDLADGIAAGFERLLVTGGRANGVGGAIAASASSGLSLDGVVIAGNTAGSGGGVFATAAGPLSVEIEDSALSGNVATEGGGALFLLGSPLALAAVRIDGSVFADNAMVYAGSSPGRGFGGAAAFGNAAVEVVDSRFEDNVAEPENGGAVGRGGAIALSGPGSSLALEGSLVSGNVAGAQGGGVFLGSGTSLAGGTTSDVFRNNRPDDVFGPAAPADDLLL